MKNHVLSYSLWEQEGKSMYSQPKQVLIRFKEEQDIREVERRLEDSIPDFDVHRIENEKNKEFAFLANVETHDEEIRAAFPDADVEIKRLPSQEGGPKLLGV